ncbi:hypothetical protein LCGC14_2345080 [marine sediment metagenome]|uniref:Uncharacterized protein n=1 Tax=marine sediment metagenome TaxID=412755 RepID=A0A0F9CYC7_9ZZZZ
MKIERAVKRLIDNVWTLEFQRVGDGAKILSYSWQNPIGYDQESELPNCRFLEGPSNPGGSDPSRKVND